MHSNRRLFCWILGIMALTAGPASPAPPTTEAFALSASEIATVKDISAATISELMAKFFGSPAIRRNATYAILPVLSEAREGWYDEQFRNAFTQMAAGGTLKLYSSSGAQFRALIETFANSQDIHDVLDPMTVKRLGKMVDFEAIIIPRVSIEFSDDGVKTLRASMGVYDRESGETTWGGESRRQIPGRVSNGDLQHYVKWTGLGTLTLLLLRFVVGRAVAASRPR